MLSRYIFEEGVRSISFWERLVRRYACDRGRENRTYVLVSAVCFHSSASSDERKR
jgi:hypothetical protein